MSSHKKTGGDQSTFRSSRLCVTLLSSPEHPVCPFSCVFSVCLFSTFCLQQGLQNLLSVQSDWPCWSRLCKCLCHLMGAVRTCVSVCVCVARVVNLNSGAECEVCIALWRKNKSALCPLLCQPLCREEAQCLFGPHTVVNLDDQKAHRAAGLNLMLCQFI